MSKGKSKPGSLAVMGAPTKFRHEYIAQLIEFFDVQPFQNEVCEQNVEYFVNGKVKKAGVKYKLVPNAMPTLFQFARRIGVAYSTVWRWAERGDDPELERRLQAHLEGKEVLPGEELLKIKGLKDFCNAYKDAKELQKEFLINLGLAGVSPPSSFIFVAKNVTDMRDERRHTISGPNGGPISMQINELSDDELIKLASEGQSGTGQ